MSEPTTLYRFFDENDLLLYVGISGNPGRRFAQHAGDKPWWNQVALSTMEHYDDRESALRAERQAIRNECPQYNVAHNDHDGGGWVGKFMRDVWNLFGAQVADTAVATGQVAFEDRGRYADGVATTARREFGFRAAAMKDSCPSATPTDIVAALLSSGDDTDLAAQLEYGKTLRAGRVCAARNMAELARQRDEPSYDGSHQPGIAEARRALQDADDTQVAPTPLLWTANRRGAS